MFSFGRIEVLEIHRFEQSVVRDLQTAPSTRLGSRHTLDRSESCQRLAGARDDDLLAGERSIEQRRKLSLCPGYVDLQAIALTSVMF